MDPRIRSFPASRRRRSRTLADPRLARTRMAGAVQIDAVLIAVLREAIASGDYRVDIRRVAHKLASAGGP